jgi:hypothetical protein
MECMDRTVDFLLKKYETKQPGEQWKLETEYRNLKEYRDSQRIFLLDGIINNLHGNFNITKPQKDRIKYLIKDLDFNLPQTEEQYIVMILIYVKLETNRNSRVRDYYNLLGKYDLTINHFVKFLISLNKHHINKIPLPYSPPH